jgi:hypothetical protein
VVLACSNRALAAHPAGLELDVIAAAHPSDPAPAEALDLAIERQLDFGICADNWCRRGRQQGGQALHEAMLHLSVAYLNLGYTFHTKGQTATADRQLGAQQVQRLMRLEVRLVDQDQRLSQPASSFLARAASIGRALRCKRPLSSCRYARLISLRIPVPAPKRPPTSVAHSRGRRLQQRCQVPTVHGDQQRAEAAL